MTIVANIPNLLDRSRFGPGVRFVDSAAEIEPGEAELIIVDLDRCDEPEAFVVAGARLIGFGPHVDTDLHARAIAAGYDEVLARSVFFRRLDDLTTLPPAGRP